MNTETILFFIFGVSAIVSAIFMVTRKNPIISAIFLILNFFTVAVIYLLLKAQFIAIIQVLVYMGAIMVLFLFVIMLLNLKEDAKITEQLTYKKITSILLSILLLSVLGVSFYLGFQGKQMSDAAEKIGTAESLGKALFTTYSFHVLAAGMLLLATIVGAVILAKKKFD
jgi:NADH-quinone oxidoreductase subunit J